MLALSQALIPNIGGRPLLYRKGMYPVHHRHRSMVRPPARPRVTYPSLWSTPLARPRPARKVAVYRNPSLTSSKLGLRRDPGEFDNYVTPSPREETPLKNSYEVTTERFEDTEPAPLTADNDAPIAIDDEEESVEEEEEEPLVGWRRPDQDPRYRSSYGRGRYRWFKKKPTGRVRIQVFRGPNRKYGHKSYAQWGYYVVQPAESVDHHHRHHPYKK